MKAIWKNTIIAESQDTVVIENNHYFPRESVHSHFLRDSSHTSVCGWKGTANYYSLEVNGSTNNDAAWYYNEPKDAAKAIAGHIAFWRGVQVLE